MRVQQDEVARETGTTAVRGPRGALAGVGAVPPLDLDAVVDAIPLACVLLAPDLTVLASSDLYLRAVGRRREQVVGRPLLDAFPDPTGPDPTGPVTPGPVTPGPAGGAAVEAGAGSAEVLRASFERVLATGRPDVVPLLRHDLEPDPFASDRGAAPQERWWSLVGVPVRGRTGGVDGLLLVVEDVTAAVRAREDQERRADEQAARARTLDGDLAARGDQVRDLSTADQLAARRLAGLAAAALALVAAEGLEDLAAVVAESAASALGCDASALALVTDDPELVELRMTSGSRALEVATAARVPLAGGLPTSAAIGLGQRVLLRDRRASAAWGPQMEQLMTVMGAEAFASLPLVADNRVLGSLTLGWRGAQDFAPTEVELLEAFAGQCARALQRIVVRDAERVSATAARRMSETLQRSLLGTPPRHDRLLIDVRYLPAAHDDLVGGDWYDVFAAADGTTSLVIGDVAGHDRDAAATMGQVRNLLRGVAHAVGEPPAAVVRLLDSAMRTLELEVLVTAVLAHLVELPGDRWRVTWSNAGHLPPLLVRADGTGELLRTESDLLLGLDPTTPRRDHVVELGPGDTLLLYTDGLVERRSRPLREGLEELRGRSAELAALPFEQWCGTVLADLHAAAEDDVALLLVRPRATTPDPGPASAPATAPEAAPGAAAAGSVAPLA